MEGDSAEQEFGVCPGFGSWEWHLELTVQPQPTSVNPWMFGRCPAQERATNTGIPPQPFLRDPRSCKITRGDFSRNPAWRGHLRRSLRHLPPPLPATPRASSMEPPLGLDAAAEHIWEPRQQENSCKQLDQDKNATLEHSTGLGVQNANKTPNHSVCCNSQTKHG